MSDALVTAPSVGAPGLEPDGIYLPDSIDTSRPVPLLLALHHQLVAIPAETTPRMRRSSAAFRQWPRSPVRHRNTFAPHESSVSTRLGSVIGQTTLRRA